MIALGHLTIVLPRAAYGFVVVCPLCVQAADVDDEESTTARGFVPQGAVRGTAVCRNGHELAVERAA